MSEVSVSMIVKNEEKHLAAAIQTMSQQPWVSEIVIIDTGSTDRSIEIAKDFGAKVFEEVWQSDFSYHRNNCLDLCQNDWVF